MKLNVAVRINPSSVVVALDKYKFSRLQPTHKAGIIRVRLALVEVIHIMLYWPFTYILELYSPINVLKGWKIRPVYNRMDDNICEFPFEKIAIASVELRLNFRRLHASRRRYVLKKEFYVAIKCQTIGKSTDDARRLLRQDVRFKQNLQ